MDLIMKLLDAYLAEHAGTRVNGNVAAEESATRHREALQAAVRRLWELGYKLTDLRNISERHLKALCADWHGRGLKPKTINGYLSHLKIFCERNGKKGLVKKSRDYLPHVPPEELKVETTTKKSKSWHEAGVNVPKLIKEAFALDERFGVMLTMQVAFGFRLKEVLMLKPWVVDVGDSLAVTETKNGRPRHVYIDTSEQRWAINQAKSITKRKNDTLGWQERPDGKPMKGASKAKASYAYSERHYFYLMEKLGITRKEADCTGHGLRAQYAENSALLRGMIPPTLGGTGGQMDAGERDMIRLQVSEALGHSRLSVTGAYYGSFGRNAKPDASDAMKLEIEAGLDAVPVEILSDIPFKRKLDCAQLAFELSAIEVYADQRRIHYLWEDHSRRNGVLWVSLSKDSNLAALNAAATSTLKASRRTT